MRQTAPTLHRTAQPSLHPARLHRKGLARNMVVGMTAPAANAPLFVGLGEVLWDLLPTGPRPGGAPANFAFHAAQLGARAALASAVGPDEEGSRLCRHFTSLGIDVSPLQVSSLPTGAVDVTLDPSGHPDYSIRNHVAWDDLHLTADWSALAARTDAVCFGSLAQRDPRSRTAILGFLDATPAACLRVFDANLRGAFYTADILTASLERARLFKASSEEWPTLAWLLGLPDDPAAATPVLFSRHPRLEWIAVTHGAAGSTVHTRSTASTQPASPLPRPLEPGADTVGAGDAFTAALTWGLRHGQPLHHAQTQASHLAAFVCSRAGATPLHPRSSPRAH